MVMLHMKLMRISNAATWLQIFCPQTRSDPGDGINSKKEGKDRESIQLSTTPDPGYQLESDNFTILDFTNESQEVSPSPAGNHKASIIRRP